MFEVSVAVDSVANRILSMPIVGSIARNPIYTALLITFIILIIILIVFRNAETDESLLVLGLRSSFYVFIATLIVVFLHNHVLMTDVTADARDTRTSALFNGSSRTAGYDDVAVRVAPGRPGAAYSSAFDDVPTGAPDYPLARTPVAVPTVGITPQQAADLDAY